jgi:hypothetical protein
MFYLIRWHNFHVRIRPLCRPAQNNEASSLFLARSTEVREQATRAQLFGPGSGRRLAGNVWHWPATSASAELRADDICADHPIAVLRHWPTSLASATLPA